VKSARLTIRKDADQSRAPAPPVSDYVFTVSVVTARGRSLREERRALIAPHDPDVFHKERSTRQHRARGGLTGEGSLGASDGTGNTRKRHGKEPTPRFELGTY
jgi:hypothetical protein